MKRLIVVPVFAALLLLAQASRTTQLAPGVWYWQGNRDLQQPANCGWIEFKDYVFVIDANYPWGAKEILPEIKRTTTKPIRFVFNTHYHGDHAYGSALFVDAGAAVVCSADCAVESRTKGQAGFDKNKDVKPYRLEHPTLTFADTMVFDDGTHRVELTKVGPGHSKGDAVAWLPKERILFSGDLCVNWKSGNNVADRDADIPNWVRVLDRLAGWNIQTLIPGHGAPGATATLRAQRAYLDDMWTQVAAGKRAGKSADDLARSIDLGRHGNFAADPERNAGSIRAMYLKAP
jgi:glyoxylase-like metal-dependent hydrolase (beta-lactamase superfamily II)